MRDIYTSFSALEANEVNGVDFRIFVADRGTDVAVIAPHGGRIEPGTMEIAQEIAGNTLSFYAFEGLRVAGKRGSLHITSTRFDEPKALALVGGAQTVVAIHGRADGRDPQTVSVGGLHDALRDRIVRALGEAGFDTIVAKGNIAGQDPSNICNRSATGAGVQLELPRTLRRKLATEPTRLRAFCDTVRRAALANW